MVQGVGAGAWRQCLEMRVGVRWSLVKQVGDKKGTRPGDSGTQFNCGATMVPRYLGT